MIRLVIGFVYEKTGLDVKSEARYQVNTVNRIRLDSCLRCTIRTPQQLSHVRPLWVTYDSKNQSSAEVSPVNMIYDFNMGDSHLSEKNPTHQRISFEPWMALVNRSICVLKRDSAPYEHLLTHSCHQANGGFEMTMSYLNQIIKNSKEA